MNSAYFRVIGIGGTGLFNGSDTISVDVPAGATVNQVLIYWHGVTELAGPDDTIEVNGTEATGTLIGEPTFIPGPNTEIQSYRADITTLGVISDGNNVVNVGGLSFDRSSDGAGILVIFDDGSTVSSIDVRDGNDFAFINMAAPLNATVPQTFTFPAEAVDRTADLSMFVANVGSSNRPNAVDITVDGVTTTIVNPFASVSGQFWDTISIPVNVPADSVTVEVASRGD